MGSEWVSINDKLPSDGVVVALCGGDIERYGLETTAGFYDERYGCFCALLEENETELCVANHWQSLPAKYEKEIN